MRILSKLLDLSMLVLALSPLVFAITGSGCWLYVEYGQPGTWPYAAAFYLGLLLIGSSAVLTFAVDLDLMGDLFRPPRPPNNVLWALALVIAGPIAIPLYFIRHGGRRR